MKPVAIFRHNSTEGPGYFATFLEAHSIPFKVIAIDCGNPVPTSIDMFSGLCFMGGPMSVNDPLAWIAEECALIRLAIEHDIPVIGHCLGGQLMSKALGGTITQNPVKEIGWGEALAENSEIAHHWLGETLGNVSSAATLFQWHGETFSLPQGATRILTNDFCTNQMFALGRHLGMQCHVEMTPEMIAEWSKSWASEVAGMPALPDSVQTPEQIQAQTSAHLTGMRRLADQLYTVWIGGLSR
jgi:GMP synthase-like glutamine amidotransferase